MDTATLLLLFGGGLVAGGVTAVAGGSSFMIFPILIAAGLPPLVANITTWIALIPGNFMALAAYRTELRDMRDDVRLHLVVSFAGGITGSLLLLWTGEARFERAKRASASRRRRCIALPPSARLSASAWRRRRRAPRGHCRSAR